MKATALLLLLLLSVHSSAQTNVRSLGAAGDGVKDDTAVLQKAISAGVGDLYFPKGTYRLTKPLEFDLTKTGVSSVSGDGSASLLMEGPGPALRFIGSHGGTAAPSTVHSSVWERERTPMVAGVEIVGRHPEADGIEANGTMQLTVSRVVVREARHAVHLVRRNRNVVLADCHFYHNTGIGVFYDAVNLHQSNITNCHISYNGGGGVVSRGGNVRNLQIGACDIEGNQAADGPPTANVWLDSTGGSIAEVAITGCTIQHTHKAKGSANIRITGAGSDEGLARRIGEGTTNEGHVTIGNNVFSDVQVNIEIQNARGVTVTGNTFWEGFEHDLSVEKSSRVVVSGNNFDRNPRYAVNGFLGAEHNGILLRDCSEVSLTGNVISGVLRETAAVQILDCRRILFNSNSIFDSDGSGLLLRNVTDSVVNGNLVRDDRPLEVRSTAAGIAVVGGSANLVGANLLQKK
jgi:Pectate lyase superfamily protein/Right handed beta helix region